MKLPTFQAQQGTSMASAMTTPAQMGQIKARIPVTKRLEGTRSVQGELNLGLQKSRLYQDMGQSVMKVAQVYDQIDEANQGLAEKAASAEHANTMAAWLTDAKQNSRERDEDGNYGYETLEARYQEESEIVKAIVRDKYRFTRKDAEARFKINTDGTVATHNVNISTHKNDRRVDNIAYNYEVAKNSVNTLGGMTALADFAFQKGAITAKQAQTDVEKYKERETFRANTLMVDAVNDPAKLVAMRDANDANEANMTLDQVNSVERKITEKLTDLSLADVRTARKAGGSIEQARRIEELDNCGPACTHTRGETDHGAMIGRLWTEFNRGEKADTETTIGQAKSSEIHLYRNGGPNTYVSSAMKSAVDKDANILAVAESDNFFEDAVPEINFGIGRGYLGKPLTSRMERELTGGDAHAATALIKQINNASDTQLIDLKGDAEEKFSFYSVNSESMTPEEVDAAWAVQREMSDREIKITETAAELSMKDENIIDDLVSFEKDTREGDDFLVKGEAWFDFSFKDAVGKDPMLQSEALTIYKDKFVLLGTKDKALKATWETLKNKYGPTQVTGERKLKRQPPEKMVSRPPETTPEEHTKSINTQFDTQFDYLNDLRESVGQPKLDKVNTELVYGDGEWFVINKYGEKIIHPAETKEDGSPVDVTFKFETEPYASEIATQQRDAGVYSSIIAVEDMLGSLNYEYRVLAAGEGKDGKAIDIESNQINEADYFGFTSVTEQGAELRGKFEAKKDFGRNAANRAWHTEYANIERYIRNAGRVEDESMLSMNIERYLFSRGYMKMGNDGEIQLPVGIE